MAEVTGLGAGVTEMLGDGTGLVAEDAGAVAVAVGPADGLTIGEAPGVGVGEPVTVTGGGKSFINSRRRPLGVLLLWA